ncbi:MAG TPA: FAD:protein FMN transferase [Rhodocyclaceae bacterium]|nr:FAD:protein FMN transferase [Rhodocyclaceae bacterium]
MLRFNVRLSSFLLLFIVCTLLSACGDSPLVRQESFVFGTRVEIVSYGTPAPQAREALAETLREFDRMHHAYHAWQPSQLTTLNAHIAAGQSTTVSAELIDLLRISGRYSELSEGLFEPAIGGLIAAWGFQADQFVARLPPEKDITRLVAAKPRSTDLEFNGLQVRSANPAVQFDFGGLVKGYALDRAAQILHRHGVNNALINIGGNVMALGKKGDVPWQVGIQSPRSAAPLATLALYDGEAIGTSGDYQRFFELNGKRYSHLIDPRTGRPSEAAQAVTILITPQATGHTQAGTLSDLTSKPIFLAGVDWPRMARKLNVSYVLRVDPHGAIQVTPAMRARLRWADGVVASDVK